MTAASKEWQLALDPLGVLSAWEKMGGSAFASEDVNLDLDVDLDLTYWEARLKPLAAPPAAQPNLFTSMFTPAEMGLAFLPGFCFQPAAATTTVGVHTGAPSEVEQVVPLCCTVSGGSLHDNSGATGLGDGAGVFDEAPECSHLTDDGAMSVHFSDLGPTHASPSATCSEAGVVPDCRGSPPCQAQPLIGASTATSGSTSQQGTPAPGSDMLPIPFTNLAAPAPSLPASFFVPVSQPACKQEPDATEDVHMQPAQQARQTRSQASAAAVQAPAQALAAGGTAHIRTRAECLERYRQKKARRHYTKRVRYQLRKINADRRPRIKGRFVKKEELADFLAVQRGGRGGGGACVSEEAYFDDIAMPDPDSDYYDE